MRRSVSRRHLLAAVPVAIAGCESARAEYFGNISPPSTQQLVFEVIFEPEGLDPTINWDPASFHIVQALFEGLTTSHPVTADPMAGLATHYRISDDGRRITFYLRGHPAPKGIRLANTNDLPFELTQARRACSAAVPARWSDGRVITADDFVYAWRRGVDPKSAAPLPHLFHCIEYGREITMGRRVPEELGVRSIDDFTLDVQLETPTPYFLQLTAVPIFFAVPAHVVAAAGTSWTDPARIVSSGPFVLRESRSHDYVSVDRNPFYYEASVVRLNRIVFVPFSDRNTLVNCYKAGAAQLTVGAIPAMLSAKLAGKRDYHSVAGFAPEFSTFNTSRHPFNNVLLRYAFNMAVDKRAMAALQGPGASAAPTLVPPVPGYVGPDRVSTVINNRECNVLAFDPQGARELLAAAGFPRGRDSEGKPLVIEYLYPTETAIRTRCEIVQQFWRRYLGVEVKLVGQDFATYFAAQVALEYKHIAHSFDVGYYRDANWFLSQFVTGSTVTGTGWSDPQFDRLLRAANGTLDRAARSEKLRECEAMLMRAMPVLPVFFSACSYLQKPYVRGTCGNATDVRRFKYAWIDTTWRPA